MVGQAIILGLIVVIANIDWFIGKTNICRPIILGLLVGAVMGDVKTGIIMGATLELAFIGAVAIGASIPPDVMVGGTLGVAFAISGGHGPETALLLALPIASLALFVRLFCLAVINPFLLHRADKYADDGNVRGIESMHIIGGMSIAVTAGIVTMVAYVVGGPAVEAFLNTIPGFLQGGMYIAMGILPALGFAMLAKLLFSKNVAAFFFLGFLVAAYLKIPVTGMALLGFVCAVIMVFISRKQRQPNLMSNDGGNKNDEF